MTGLIDEELLREKLAEEAASFSVPEGATRAILERAGGAPASPVGDIRRPLRWPARVAVAAAVLVAAAAIAGSFRSTDPGVQRADTAELQADEDAASSADATAEAPVLGIPNSGAGAGGGSADLTVDSGNLPALSGEAETAGAPAIGALPAFQADAKVVKTGTLEIEVRDGRFGSTVDRIIGAATGLGGFVADSTAHETGEAPRGSVTVRVPADRFEELLADMRRLGEVQSATTSGRDVTPEYTDIEARLVALDAARNQLLTVLTDAETVPDILAVQDRITGVQTQIEQLQGQKRVLDDQTSLATLTVEVAEPGADEPVAVDERSGLGQAWDEAQERFGNGVERIVAGSGTVAVLALFFALIGLLGRGGWLVLRRRLV